MGCGLTGIMPSFGRRMPSWQGVTVSGLALLPKYEEALEAAQGLEIEMPVERVFLYKNLGHKELRGRRGHRRSYAIDIAHARDLDLHGPVNRPAWFLRDQF